MTRLFEQLFEVVQRITEALGYPGIFLMMLLENLVPPLPSEVVMPFAGSLIDKGGMTLFGILLAGTLGSGVGAVILYWIGYRLGRQNLERWMCRYGKYVFLSARDMQRALDLFQRHGKSTIFFARLVPGVRSLISIPAGVNRMPFGSFLGLTLLGTLAWNLLLTSAGFYLGQNWERVLALVDTYELVLIAAFGAGLLFFLLRKFQERGTPAARSGCEELEV